ncbi:hypothetical protein, partial [Streptomyces tricolor]
MSAEFVQHPPCYDSGPHPKNMGSVPALAATAGRTAEHALGRSPADTAGRTAEHAPADTAGPHPEHR